MELALKQRLTGAIILVVIGVIFIPLLLDGAGYHARYTPEPEQAAGAQIEIKSWDEIQQIPAAPAGNRVSQPVKAPQKPQTSNTSEQKPADISSKTAQPKSTSDAVTKQPERVVKQPTIKAWALQLGSFSQQTNALVLRDQLRAKGYRAFVDKSVNDGQISYKVKVGPELTRSKLEKVASKLEQQEKLKSLVVSHP